MPLEIEAKIRLDNHDAVRCRLGELGARRIGRVRERNTILDDAAGTLRRRGAGLRVRHLTILDGAFRSSTLTYKGPRQPSEVKAREELSIDIDDADRAIRILEAIGFGPILIFEKIRESWKLDPCVVELDSLPLLGSFVEIEGPDVAGVERVRADLGLGSKPHIAHSYVHLLLTLQKSTGHQQHIIRFTDLPAD